jgi:hypothetical protein
MVKLKRTHLFYPFFTNLLINLDTLQWKDTTWKTHFGNGYRWPLVTGKALITVWGVGNLTSGLSPFGRRGQAQLLCAGQASMLARVPPSQGRAPTPARASSSISGFFNFSENLVIWTSLWWRKPANNGVVPGTVLNYRFQAQAFKSN